MRKEPPKPEGVDLLALPGKGLGQGEEMKKGKRWFLYNEDN